jgi:adenosylhomocysteine nucleosidase
MDQILIAFATYREANPTLKALEASSSSQKNLFTFSNGYILITGIGMLAAASQTALHLPLVQEVWNFGIAGALQDDLPIGTVCPIQSVSKFLLLPENVDAHTEQMASNIFPAFSLETTGTKLITSDFPIHQPHMRSRLSESHQIVDMEGYGIAYAAMHAQKPCRLWKIISDFSTSEGQKLITQHIDRLAEQISELVLCQVQNNASFG